jgi:hypothetical protein
VGLNDVLARSAAGCAHVLVVEVPGLWRDRAAVEHAVLSRGWRLADSPADADVLVVCGQPGPRLAAAVDLVWNQMPGPRVRVDVGEHDEVNGCLDGAYTSLLDTVHHRHDARARSNAFDVLADAEGEQESHEEAEHGEHQETENGEHGEHQETEHGEHGEMDHGGHEGHGGMDMSPGGIPLAEGGEDRDDLEMDVLQVRLGPVLPHWPSGLVLDCSLHGDVIASARAELVDGAPPRHSDSPPRARTLDNVASLLALAGWGDAAGQARRLRDALLEHGQDEPASAGLERLRKKVRRSWLLRWSLRGLCPVSQEVVHQNDLPVEASGDTYDRLLQMLDGASAPTYSTTQLAHLASGLDLAAARLVIASLDVHELRTEHADHGVAHG